MWYPAVLFWNGQQRFIGPFRFSSRLVGVGHSFRSAIPLKLAWAITIHKAHGMTLDYVKVDLKGSLAERQIYVALNRGSHEEGFDLHNFSANKVRASPKVITL